VHLSKTSGDDKGVFGNWWATYEGQNSTGSVSAFASFPDLLDKKINRFWARYEVATETPMPEAMLAHLLKLASETKISGGDSIEIELPFRAIFGGCFEQRTIRVRLTTGALVTNTSSVTCPVRK